MANSDDPTDIDVHNAAIAAALSRFQCSFPAIVESYDPSTERATVQPAIRIRAEGGQQVTPKVVTIPVGWPGWGSILIKGELVQGDEVIVECMDKNWLVWLQSGGIVDYNAIGGHQAGYAVAKPVRLSSGRRGPGTGGNTVIGRDDGQATIILTQTGDGSLMIQSPVVRLGSSGSPALAVGRDTDPVNTNAAFTTWRSAVEAGILAAGGGVVTPLVGSAIGTIDASSTEVTST